MNDIEKILITKNKYLKGSIFLNNDKKNIDKDDYMIENMSENLAFKNQKNKNQNKKNFLDDFKNRFKKYRQDWNQQPESCIKNKYTVNNLKEKKVIPLCIDIEVASICDLACPFCYREFIVTPDKIINDKLCYRIIDQASDLGVPSIKFNWRGEPLLNPKIYDYIKYAKKKGILETIINTNATNLTETNSKKLIDCGLDLMIYSFDGGTKKTYEKMRPGRFKKNTFEKVYLNIKKFKEIREKNKAKFPFTKIQMILTNETVNEVNEFFENFRDYVDNVSLNQYTERGGNVDELSEDEKKKYNQLLEKNKLPNGTAYMRDIFGNISVSTGREPCKQIYQRLLITYEGKVGMCCHDWGASHTVGFTDDLAFDNFGDYKKVAENVKKEKPGFELLKEAKISKNFNNPKKKVDTIKDIWLGDELDKVRKKHINDKSEDVSICSKCTFKDVYKWSR